MKPGDKVIYEGNEYVVRGFAASVDHLGQKLVEIDWDNYLAVPIGELRFANPDECTHGITFDEEAACGLSSYEIRKRWPRLTGQCPLHCGFNGIGYASYLHYISGDW